MYVLSNVGFSVWFFFSVWAAAGFYVEEKKKEDYCE